MTGNNIPIYAPWAENQLRINRHSFEEGNVPVLYLELSAKCTWCHCLYCDSPTERTSRNEMDLKETVDVLDQAAKLGLHWAYICGLGEPSEDKKLFPVLNHLSKLRIRTTFFTNGLGFQPSDIRQLKLNKANLILKVDSFRPDIFDRILNSKGVAKRIYRFLDGLLEESFIEVGPEWTTNLAFSIVPTKLNLDSIPEVIEFCKEHSIYPVVGEMELVGRALENVSILKPSDDELKRLHDRISGILGYPYVRPLCSGIIDGIHIDHLGNCVVDSLTGLSCGWFIAEESKMQVIGNVRHDKVSTLREKVRQYRLERLENTLAILQRRGPIIACGGGARPSEWVQEYIRTMRNAR